MIIYLYQIIKLFINPGHRPALQARREKKALRIKTTGEGKKLNYS
jgi:hypothetical protein